MVRCFAQTISKPAAMKAAMKAAASNGLRSARHSGSDSQRCDVSRHRCAMMAVAKDVVQLSFADAEKCNGGTHRITGEALGAQPRIVERHTQRRIVGAQR